MMAEFLIRRSVVEAGHRLYACGLVAATDGNISARLPGRRLLVTPAGSCLGELCAEDLIVVTDLSLSGRPPSDHLPARRRPTSELPLHLAAYAERPDIAALVHAHPLTVTAFTVAGLTLDLPVLPEVLLSLGPIATAPYATPSTGEGARVIRGIIGAHDVIVLDRHGAIAVGTDAIDACRKMEKLEQAARILLNAHQLGRVQTLPEAEVERLNAMRLRCFQTAPPTATPR
ncbi:MAG: class II aldolase/adducin family protein [Candidatus Eisenbacteria bacterium]